MNKTKPIVEVIYADASKQYNSVYKDSAYSKMIVIEDDEKFPSPRLCLLRKWPNFEGFGFTLCEELLNTLGSLKVESVIKNSPAEIGGLRINDIIIEINNEYVEYKSFFDLIKILQDALSQDDIELLVLSELDADWYKERGIIVNSKFPNIEYCETPYYGYKFRDLDSNARDSNTNDFNSLKILNPQLEFHSNTGKLYKKTYIVDRNKNTLYKRLEDLSKKKDQQNSDDDGFDCNNESSKDNTLIFDNEMNATVSSNYRKFRGDALHDNWSTFMDNYLNIKYNRNSNNSINNHQAKNFNKDNIEKEKSTLKKNYLIKLNDVGVVNGHDKEKRSHSLNTPRDSESTFSFLFSGRDDQELRPFSYLHNNTNVHENNEKSLFKPISKLYPKNKPLKPLVPTSENSKPNVIYTHEIKLDRTKLSQENYGKINLPQQTDVERSLTPKIIKPNQSLNNQNSIESPKIDEPTKLDNYQKNEKYPASASPGPIKSEIVVERPLQIDHQLETIEIIQPINHKYEELRIINEEKGSNKNDFLKDHDDHVEKPPLPISLPPSLDDETKKNSISDDYLALAVGTKLALSENQSNSQEDMTLNETTIHEDLKAILNEPPVNQSGIENEASITRDLAIETEYLTNLKTSTNASETQSKDQYFENDLFKSPKAEISELYENSETPNVTETCLINEENIKDFTKTFKVVRDMDFFGFGIVLHTEKDGNAIDDDNILFYPSIEIEDKSPAYFAGLKNDQRLIAIDNKYIKKHISSIQALVQGIDESYYQRGLIEFSVIDPEIWNIIKNKLHLLNFLYNHQTQDDVKKENDEQPKPDEEYFMDTEILSQKLNAVEDLEREDDNKSLDKTESVLVPSTQAIEKSVPRLCHLVRLSREEQYGFDFKTLKAEGKHVAINVRDGFPAQKAGLRNGDFIMEVNGIKVESVEHDKIVNLIFTHDNDVDLLVVEDLKGYKAILKAQERAIDGLKLNDKDTDKNEIIKASINKNEIRKNGKISYHRVLLMESYKGLGLHLAPNGLISYVETLSPADIAGLQKGQKILEINNIDVSCKSNVEIASLIKENANNLEVGVRIYNNKSDISQTNQTKESIINENKNDENRNSLKKPFEATEATQTTENSNLIYENEIVASSFSLPQNPESLDKEAEKVRVCNLISRPDFRGFGFALKRNKENGPHQITNIEINSPAYISGLKDEDYLLKINDELVYNERYSQTVIRIKNATEYGRMTLEVIQPNYYKVEAIYHSNRKNSNSSLRQSSPLMSSSVKRNNYENADELKKFRSSSDLVKSTQSLPEYSKIEDKTNIRPLSYNNLEQIQTPPTEQISRFKKSTSRSLSSLKPKFKKCTVILTPNFKGFGFKINRDLKPKYKICDVDKNSPAERANIQPNDVLIEINNKNIRRSKFEKVRNMLIDAVGVGRVDLLLISMEGYLWFKKKNKRFSKILATLDSIDQFSSSEFHQNNIIDSEISVSNPNLQNGIDNATLINEKINCTIFRKDNFNGYGLTLSIATAKASKVSMPIITNIELGSPAADAGLEVNDEILEINGNSTYLQKNEAVSNMIKRSGNRIDLLINRKKSSVVNPYRSSAQDSVQMPNYEEINKDNFPEDERKIDIIDNSSENNFIDEDIMYQNNKFTYENDKNYFNDTPNFQKEEMNSSKIQITNSEDLKSNSEEYTENDLASFKLPRDAPAPRLCRVRVYESDLGFDVLQSKKTPGLFKVGQIVPNSAAYLSGLRDGDIIIEINGTNVQSMNDEELSKLMNSKKEKDDLQMLVVDQNTLSWYRDRDIPISSRLVPKLTYIETILQEEMENNLVDSTSINRLSQSQSSIESDRGIKHYN